MIPEQAKSEIIKRRAIGATWTKIAEWLEQEYGVQVHRTTLQKWFDKNHWEPEDELLVNEEGTDNRIKLDKKLATYKGEADYYKKLYNGLLKDTILNNLFKSNN